MSATALKVEATSVPTLQMKRHMEFALQIEKHSPVEACLVSQEQADKTPGRDRGMEGTSCQLH